MKKLIYILLHICFFISANAQTTGITEGNNFIAKINTKLSTLHAAQFLVKRTSPLEEGQTNPSVQENKGFFKIVPSDKVEGCKYFFQIGDDKMLYDGNYAYVGYYRANLYITDAKKYPEKAKIPYMLPNPFQNLLKLFLDDYGNTPKQIAFNCERFMMEINISIEEKDNITYNVITCKRTLVLNSIKIPQSITTLYATSNYLPIKLVTIYLNYNMEKEEYNIEQYTLLQDLPDAAFSTSLLGNNYYEERYYRGEEKGYISKTED